jgi:hypothetical protein
MPTDRRPLHRAHRGRLNHAQQMWLRYGWDERWDDAFNSEEEYRDAWLRNRARMLAGCAPGRRPIAWWVVESGGEYPGYDKERVALFEADLLDPAERDELLGCWRRSFERGERSDIPDSLWAEWEEQRRDEETAEQPVPAPAA